MNASRIGLAAALALSACAGSSRSDGFASDWEQQHARLLEGPVRDVIPPVPALPRRESLLEFRVEPSNGFRYFIDGQSISVSERHVRYTLIARSPSGVGNISFEAIDCKERQFRSYARASDAGGWIERPTDWRQIQTPLNVVQWVLQRQYFCPGGIAVRDGPDAIAALRAGGHPWARPATSAPTGR